MSEPKFYTIKEFAKILKIDETIIQAWTKEGILKCIYVGDGITRIHKSELERLLNGLENGLESKNKGI